MREDFHTSSHLQSCGIKSWCLGVSVLVSMAQPEEIDLALPLLVHGLCWQWAKVPHVTHGVVQTHPGDKLLVEENGSEPAHWAWGFSMKMQLMRKPSAAILSVQ